MAEMADLNVRVSEQILQLQTFLLLTGLKNFLYLNINKDIKTPCEKLRRGHVYW